VNVTQVGRLAIVGTGLIGASVGLAAQRAGVGTVTGWDPDGEALRVAVERGAVSRASSLADAVVDAQLVLVAAPVGDLPRTVRDVLDLAGEASTVTDVGSTKGPVCAAAATEVRFIGGHPICGAETRGPGRATADLFDGATWFLAPTAATAPERLRLVHGFVAALGAQPVAIGPDAHDRLVGLTSHLPHILANVLLNHAGSTRIAGANPRIWVDILLDNSEALSLALAEQRRALERVERALAEEDAGYLARWIGEASAHRRRLLETSFADPGALQRLRIHIPDRPGVLAGIFQALGAERIHIEDFEMDHVSSERGGTLTVLVSGEGEAERAVRLLEAQGYGVVTAPVIAE
jgi:prephenate dehydrogenase